MNTAISKFFGDLNQALKVNKHCLMITEKWHEDCPKLEEANVALMNSYNNLAEVFHPLGKYDEAKKYFHNALDVCLQLLEKQLLTVDLIYSNLGVVYGSLKIYHEAIKYHEWALEIRLARPDAHPHFIAISYNNLGSVYQGQGKYTEALENYKKGIAACEEAHDEKQSIIVASIYSNMATVCRKQGRFEDGIEFLEKALKIRRKKLGEHHFSTAKCYLGLGGIYHNIDCTKALKYFQKVLDIWLPILGERHSDVASAYLSMGKTYCSLRDNNLHSQEKEGYHELAIKCLLKALKVYQIVSGGDASVEPNSHAQLLRVLEQLILAYEELQLSESHNLIEIYNMCVPVLGEEHESVRKLFLCMQKTKEKL